MIYPRIRYVNEPGFTHVQRFSQSDSESCFTKKLGKTQILEYWLVKHSQKIGFKSRPLHMCEARFIYPGSFT